jgi:hypothetical protein
MLSGRRGSGGRGGAAAGGGGPLAWVKNGTPGAAIHPCPR